VIGRGVTALVARY